MIAPKVVIATKEMCPVVIVDVISDPLGNTMSPQSISVGSLLSGGVKVMRVVFGKIVQSIEMIAKLSIPIKAISLLVALVNIPVSVSA